MKHAAFSVAMVLTSGMTMAGVAAGAGARDPLPVAETNAPDTTETAAELRARKVREMEAWLRRLTGNYKRYSGVSSTGILRDEVPVVRNMGSPVGEGYSSFANCIGIGSGPGIHCIFGKISWPHDQRDRPVVVAGPKDYEEAGLIMLLGINPNASEIQMLVTHGSGSDSISPLATGLVVQASAELKGDTVEWRMHCPGLSGASQCQAVYRITAPADGEYIHYTRSSAVQFKENFQRFTTDSFLVPIVAGESATQDKPRISLYDDLLNRRKRPSRPR
jgi:hypothetical protein